MDDGGSALPPVVRLLWGLRDGGRRGGPKPVLSLDRIVAAAVELADTDGLAALSMARLAEKLGFTTMSLYRYVGSKAELLVLALDAAIGAPPAQADADGDWRSRAEGWARALVGFYRTHPWTLDLPISGLPAGPNQLLWFDRGLAALAGTTLAEQEKASSVLLLANFVRSQARLSADLLGAAAAAVESGGDPQPWLTVVTRLADPERYPAVTRAVAAGVFDDPGGGAEADLDFPEDEFRFGLHRILDGLAVLDRSRR